MITNTNTKFYTLTKFCFWGGHFSIINDYVCEPWFTSCFVFSPKHTFQELKPRYSCKQYVRCLYAIKMTSSWDFTNAQSYIRTDWHHHDWSWWLRLKGYRASILTNPSRLRLDYFPVFHHHFTTMCKIGTFVPLIEFTSLNSVQPIQTRFSTSS